MAVGDLRKIEIRPKHTRHWLWYITAICFVTGALLATCIRTQTEWRRNLSIPSWRPEIIADYLKAARDEAKSRGEEINTLRAQVAKYEGMLAKGNSDSSVINKQLQKFKALMGLTEMVGPGVIVTLRDNPQRPKSMDPLEAEASLLHDYDLQRFVNELRAAGAEAVALNGQRMVERTAIRCVGPVAHVNNVPISPPFVLTAIGDPQVLYNALMIPNGIVDWFKLSLGFPVTVEKSAKLRLPAYAGSLKLRFARPLPPKQTTGADEEENQ